MDFIERIFGISPDGGSGAIRGYALCGSDLDSHVAGYASSNATRGEVRFARSDRGVTKCCGCVEASAGFLAGLAVSALGWNFLTPVLWADGIARATALTLTLTAGAGCWPCGERSDARESIGAITTNIDCFHGSEVCAHANEICGGRKCRSLKIRTMIQAVASKRPDQAFNIWVSVRSGGRESPSL